MHLLASNLYIFSCKRRMEDIESLEKILLILLSIILILDHEMMFVEKLIEDLQYGTRCQKFRNWRNNSNAINELKNRCSPVDDEPKSLQRKVISPFGQEYPIWGRVSFLNTWLPSIQLKWMIQPQLRQHLLMKLM